MSPPAIIASIVGPVFRFVLVELKKCVIGTLFRHISARLISRCAFINTLPVQPFIKGTAVVKYTVQYHPHTAPVNLLHKLRKKRIRCIQILPVRNPGNIAGSPLILLPPVCLTAVRILKAVQKPSAILHDHTVMRIYMLIILAVVFVIGRRHKNGIKINNLHPKALKIVQFLPNTFQVSTIKISYIQRLQGLFPVLYSLYRLSDINVLSGFHIIR